MKGKKMKSFKNIGVYGIARKHPKGDEKAYLSLATEPFYYNRKQEWTNFTMYVDEANVGTVCDRANLRQLINDAACEKVDHIFICSLWDFWHDAQMLKDTMDMLNNLPIPVGITFPKEKNRFCSPILTSLNDDDGYNRIIYEMLQIQKMEVEFRFLAANDNMSMVAKRTIFEDHIDQKMLHKYFFDNFIVAKEMDWPDIQNAIGLSDTDIYEIKEIGYPSQEGIEQIIAWGMRGILSHYLI